MQWAKMTTGKHKGKTLPELVFDDPDYFFWAYENNVFKGDLGNEARIIFERARNIRIPQNRNEELVVEYFTDPKGKFANLRLVAEGSSWNWEKEPALRLNVFDLSVPRRFKNYDKGGGKLLLKEVKRILFGDKTYLTKARCESFFEDLSNFDISYEPIELSR